MKKNFIGKTLAGALAGIFLSGAMPARAVTIGNSGVNVLKNDTYALAGGASYTELKISGSLGSQNIYFVEADPGTGDLYFKLGLGGGPSGTITSKAKVLSTAGSYDAASNDDVVAAVNGGFFYQSKNLLNASEQYAGPQVTTQVLSVPRGILMTGGEILCSQQLLAEAPSGAASNAFGIAADGTAVIGCPQIGITIDNLTQNTSVSADGLNRLPVNDAVLVYNDRLASSNYAMSDAVDYVVAVDSANKFYSGAAVTGTIVSIEHAAGLSAGRIVITARGSGKNRLSGYAVGDRVSVSAGFATDLTDPAKLAVWNTVQEAIGSIHMPILNGAVTPAYADYAYAYGSSAIAITNDGKIILSANDAYNAGGSAGLQFRHMDDFWVTNLNVKDMLLLDGGGSTSMVANLGSGLQFRNHAADSSGQRSVTNTMLLMAKNDNHINTFDYPSAAGAANAPVAVSAQRTLGDTAGLYIQGWSVHGRGIKGYQYRINNGQWLDLNAEYRADVAAAVSAYDCDLNAFRGTVPIASLPLGTHQISIRGINGKDIAYEIGSIHLNIVVSAGDVGTYRSHIDTFDAGNENGKVSASATVTFGTPSFLLEGWTLNQYGVTDIYYTIDDGMPAAFSSVWSRADVLAAFPQYAAANSERNAFRGNLEIAGLSVGTHSVKVYAKNSRGAIYVAAEISVNLVNSGDYINTLDSFVGQTMGNAVVSAETTAAYGTETLYVQGWSVSMAGTVSFQYNLDGGGWAALPGHYRSDVAAATPGYSAVCNAFANDMDISGLTRGLHTLLIRAYTAGETYYQVAKITIRIE